MPMRFACSQQPGKTSRKIWDRRERVRALANIAHRMAKLAVEMARNFGGLEGTPFQVGVRRLLEERPPSSRFAVLLPAGKTLIPTFSLFHQDWATFGRAWAGSFDDQEKTALRRKISDALGDALSTNDRRRFRIMTTALRELGDPAADQSLLQLARDREKIPYDDPRLPQLLVHLIRMKRPKALNLAIRILGQAGFRPQNEIVPVHQYRLWLVKKLGEAGHLEPELFSYLKDRMRAERSPGRVDEILQRVVRNLGLTPTVAVLRFLLETEWRDEEGRLLSKPEEVISSLQSQKRRFEIQHTDPQQLMQHLASDPKQSFLYYLLFSGRTQFALIDKYTPDQFWEMVQAIDRLGPVHEGTMGIFERSIQQKSELIPATARIQRLREGHWPLAEEPYARAIRIDVSSDAVLQGLTERFQAAFSPDQLGVMIQAMLVPVVLTDAEQADPRIGFLVTQLRTSAGLIELTPLVSRLIIHIPDLVDRILKHPTQRFDDKFPVPLAALVGRSSDRPNLDAKALRLRIDSEFRGELMTALRNQRRDCQDEKFKGELQARLVKLEEVSVEQILSDYVEFLLQSNGTTCQLPHRAEWERHLLEVFQGLDDLGAGKGVVMIVTLRYLDKRRDLIESLRFADTVQNCFISKGSDNWNRVLEWVSRIWKDPLSFVFLIEDNKPAVTPRQAIGFVFGSFGIKNSKPVVLLNGVYMQERTNQAVLSILDTIERDFSRPIGAMHQFVAAIHGGQIQLDPAAIKATGDGTRYTNEPTEVTRLRALAGPDGKPETKIYDDLGVGLNQPTQTFTLNPAQPGQKPHVWWKRLK